MIVLGWLGACVPARDMPGPVHQPAADGVDVALALWLPDTGVRQARGLHIVASAPVQAWIEIDDGDRVRTLHVPSHDRVHEVPLLGLGAGRSIWVTVRVEAADGGLGEATLAPFDVQPVPTRFPQIEILARDPVRMTPGYRMLNVTSPEQGASWLAILDDRAEVVWLLEGEAAFGDVRFTEAGTLVGLRAGVAEVDLLGRELALYDPGRLLHHELVPRAAGGFLSLGYADVRVDAYPRSSDAPEVLDGPADLRTEEILFLDAGGQVTDSWSLADRLDTTRVGFGSHDRVGAELRFDWSHANGVIEHPDGGVIVSVRNQGALVRLDDMGELLWVLSDPLGWSPAFEPYLLTPVGDLQWPYRQHAPELTDDGLLVVFDNHNDGHTPYGPPPAQQPESRAVAYAIDADAGTVSQVWSASSTDHLISNALGDADRVATGAVLMDHGFLDGENGSLNADAGRGRKSIRLIEVDPATPDDPALDLRIWADIDDEPEGFKSYRAEHLPTLYGPEVVEQ